MTFAKTKRFGAPLRRSRRDLTTCLTPWWPDLGHLMELVSMAVMFHGNRGLEPY
jgi:hypothetical protein